MPIYEYQCTECGALHEALQKISDAPLTDCPVCGKPALRKKVTAAAFRLKGGGWYETDFKSGNKKNLAGDSDKPAAPSTASDSKAPVAEKAATKPSKPDSSSGGTAA
jgi:putative FmdB family regulatory protein